MLDQLHMEEDSDAAVKCYVGIIVTEVNYSSHYYGRVKQE